LAGEAGHGDGEGAPKRGRKRGAGEDAGATRIGAGKHRHVQVVQDGTRKLFKGRVRQTFLEWFAATSNVTLAAKMAGVHHKTAFRHRMNDPDFAEAWDRALEQGYARIEAKLLEQKAKGEPIRIRGDLVAPETEEVSDERRSSCCASTRSRSAGGRRRSGRRARSAGRRGWRPMRK
jgi:hypothetical protein